MTPESIERLKSQLLTSGLSQKDNPLFQIINQLIDAVKEGLIANSILSGGGGGGGLGTQTFVTWKNEITTLPNSRQIQPGNGITFNLPPKRLIVNSASNPGVNDEQGESEFFPIPGPKGDRGLIGPQGPPGMGEDCCENEDKNYFFPLPINLAGSDVIGDLPDAKLSANVPLLDAANVFTNTTNTFGRSFVLTHATNPFFRMTVTGGPLNWDVNGEADRFSLTDGTDFFYLRPSGGSGLRFGLNAFPVASVFAVTGLPTSSAGLAAGDVWYDTTGALNILKIV